MKKWEERWHKIFFCIDNKDLLSKEEIEKLVKDKIYKLWIMNPMLKICEYKLLNIDLD